MKPAQSYNPNETGGKNKKIFGLPFDLQECNIVLIPVPWDVTASAKDGASDGPVAILDTSPQLDLYDEELGNIWENGIGMLPISKYWLSKNKEIRNKALNHISFLEKGNSGVYPPEIIKRLESINSECEKLNKWVKKTTSGFLENGKMLGLIGGDHSTPLGFIQALAQKHHSFSILHIDAHCDLRNAYGGFQFSHASIMYNAMKLKQIDRLVQAGIRDFCEDEMKYIRSSGKRIKVHTDRQIQHAMYKGKNWDRICTQIVNQLGEYVYISFDVDGLMPQYCTQTGTPVPSGFDFEQIMYLISKIPIKKKNIIGFDLVETGRNRIDAITSARILYRLCGYMVKSRNF